MKIAWQSEFPSSCPRAQARPQDIRDVYRLVKD